MRDRRPNEVELPNIGQIEQQLHLYLWRRGKPVEPKEVYQALAEILKLSPAQLSARRRTRYERAWNNRVQTARKNLVERGILDGSRRGFLELDGARPRRSKAIGIRSRWALVTAT